MNLLWIYNLTIHCLRCVGIMGTLKYGRNYLNVTLYQCRKSINSKILPKLVSAEYLFGRVSMTRDNFSIAVQIRPNKSRQSKDTNDLEYIGKYLLAWAIIALRPSIGYLKYVPLSQPCVECEVIVHNE